MFHIDPKTIKNIEKKGKEILEKGQETLEPVKDFSEISYSIGKHAFSAEWIHVKALLGQALSDVKKIPNIKNFDDARHLAGEAGGQVIDFAKASFGVAQKTAKEYQVWYEGRQNSTSQPMTKRKPQVKTGPESNKTSHKKTKNPQDQS